MDFFAAIPDRLYFSSESAAVILEHQMWEPAEGDPQKQAEENDMAASTAIATLSRPTQSPERVEESGFMAKLSRPALEVVAKGSSRMSFETGQIIYTESEPATGAYVVLRGKVKLVANSSDGKALILRIARPGEMISLSAALSERGNDTSAEAVEPTALMFISTSNLNRLMEATPELAFHFAQELSLEYSLLCQELSTLGLQRSAMSRLAKLLFGMTQNTAPKQGAVTSTCPLTHEEMAQMIGTSRETVTRLLHDLRDHGVATVKNEILTVNKMETLQALMN
jgi:CRP/FNR family cyclic AMP-dependent transcriptional regulator